MKDNPETTVWLDGTPDDDLGVDPNWTFDQTKKADAGKPKISLVPLEILEGIAKVREFGNTKYEPDSWKDVDPQRYKDAFLRHVIDYINDEDSIDEESGIDHFDHISCNLSFLAWFRKHKGE